MTNLQVVGFQLDVTQSLKAVLGTGARIFNFLARNNLQTNPFICAADISPSAGDSIGWRRTLESISQRSSQGKKYQGLHVGFPGQNVMADILQSPFGPRWLGILAIVSLISEEINGSDELHTLCKTVAHSEAQEYILNKEQTDQIWILSREIFLDTVLHKQYLTIMSECAIHGRRTLMSAMYPGAKKFLTPTMTAAFRIWELHSQIYGGRKLWASGSTGFAHLTLYLSAVCGFHVTVRLEKGNVCFGDKDRKVQVVIQVKQDHSEEWDTGFLVDDRSIEDTAQHFLSSGELVPWRLPDPRKSRYAPLQHSNYVLEEGYPDTPGTIMNLDLRVWMEQLEEYQIAGSISSWLVTFLLHVMTIDLASIGSDKENGKLQYHSSGRCLALTERLTTALNLLDPGLLRPEDRKDLMERLRERKEGSLPRHPTGIIPRKHIEEICTCQPKGQKQASSHLPHCNIEEMFGMLQDFALKLWLFSHMDYNSQRLLRDIGPNGGWNLLNTLPIVRKWDHALIDGPRMVSAKDLLRTVALRLTGRPIAISNARVLAIAAGGAVIGLYGNEAQEISRDTGHCLYIAPGSMLTPERRIKEMFQSSVKPSPGEFDTYTDLNKTERPYDGFGEVEYGHVVQIIGDHAGVTAMISYGKKTLPIDILRAIDLARDLRQWQGCLGDCARGRLTAEEIDKIRIVDKVNYGDLSTQQKDRNLQKKTRLTVILAHGNTLVQRAVVSHMDDRKASMIQLGSCVHCAVRHALMQHIPLLLD